MLLKIWLFSAALALTVSTAAQAEMQMLIHSKDGLTLFVIFENPMGPPSQVKVRAAYAKYDYPMGSGRHGESVEFKGRILTTGQVGKLKRMGRRRAERAIVVGFSSELDGIVANLAYYPETHEVQVVTDASDPGIFIGSDRNNREAYITELEALNEPSLRQLYKLDDDEISGLLAGRPAYMFNMRNMTPSQRIENLRELRLKLLAEDCANKLEAKRRPRRLDF